MEVTEEAAREDKDQSKAAMPRLASLRYYNPLHQGISVMLETGIPEGAIREEYDRLQYLWGEELYSENPDWGQMEQWNEELKGLEEELAGMEADEWF